MVTWKKKTLEKQQSHLYIYLTKKKYSNSKVAKEFKFTTKFYTVLYT